MRLKNFIKFQFIIFWSIEEIGYFKQNLAYRNDSTIPYNLLERVEKIKYLQ